MTVPDDLLRALRGGPRDPGPSRATDRIVRAVLDYGAHRDTHRAEVEALAQRWPTLAGALADLLREQGRPVPHAWRRLR